MTELEVTVTSVRDAQVALDAGADRVELCLALEVDGLTPSAALAERVVALGAPVHALVRCRPGDFVYREDEIATMARDVAVLAGIGVAGVVVGALGADGDVDGPAVTRLVAAAHEHGAQTPVRFHRAIDVAADPVRLAAELPDLGVRAVLTSGAAPRAAEGVDTLRAIAAAGVAVTAGGGVTAADVAALVACGVDAVHLSARRAEGDHWVTDAGLVRGVRFALDVNL